MFAAENKANEGPWKLNNESKETRNELWGIEVKLQVNQTLKNKDNEHVSVYEHQGSKIGLNAERCLDTIF